MLIPADGRLSTRCRLLRARAADIRISLNGHQGYDQGD